MNVMRPEMPYDVHEADEYRVLRRVRRSTETVWCLVAQTPKLDKALDYYGVGGPDVRLERCTWYPAPEVTP